MLGSKTVFPEPLWGALGPAQHGCPTWPATLLGSLQVEYVFSDKTGTLTSNEMQLRMIAIKGVPYGTVDYRLVGML
jgi:hypothetical protein